MTTPVIPETRPNRDLRSRILAASASSTAFHALAAAVAVAAIALLVLIAGGTEGSDSAAREAAISLEARAAEVQLLASEFLREGGREELAGFNEVQSELLRTIDRAEAATPEAEEGSRLRELRGLALSYRAALLAAAGSRDEARAAAHDRIEPGRIKLTAALAAYKVNLIGSGPTEGYPAFAALQDAFYRMERARLHFERAASAEEGEAYRRAAAALRAALERLAPASASGEAARIRGELAAGADLYDEGFAAVEKAMTAMRDIISSGLDPAGARILELAASIRAGSGAVPWGGRGLAIAAAAICAVAATASAALIAGRRRALALSSEADAIRARAEAAAVEAEAAAAEAEAAGRVSAEARAALAEARQSVRELAARVQGLEAELARVEALGLEAQTQRLSALRAIDLFLLEGRELAPTLAGLARRSAIALGADVAVIRTAACLAIGRSGSLDSQLPHDFEGDEGLALLRREAEEGRKEIVVPDLRSCRDPLSDRRLPTCFASYAAYPLFSGDAPCGTMELLGFRPLVSDRAWLDLAAGIAASAGRAIGALARAAASERALGGAQRRIEALEARLEAAGQGAGLLGRASAERDRLPGQIGRASDS